MFVFLFSVPEWPSCRRQTSWRSCSTKSRSSTRNSHSSTLNLPHIFLLFTEGGAPPTTTKRTQPIRIYLSLISAFPTAALVVSVTTHLSLSCYLIWDIHRRYTRHCFVLENKTGNEEINSETCVKFGFNFEGYVMYCRSVYLWKWEIDCLCEYS